MIYDIILTLENKSIIQYLKIWKVLNMSIDRLLGFSFNIINIIFCFFFIFSNFLIQQTFLILLVILKYFYRCFSYELLMHNFEDVRSFFYWFNFVFDLWRIVWFGQFKTFHWTTRQECFYKSSNKNVCNKFQIKI